MYTNEQRAELEAYLKDRKTDFSLALTEAFRGAARIQWDDQRVRIADELAGCHELFLKGDFDNVKVGPLHFMVRETGNTDNLTELAQNVRRMEDALAPLRLARNSPVKIEHDGTGRSLLSVSNSGIKLPKQAF